MKKTSLNRVPPALAKSFDMLGDWWGLLIVRDMLLGLRRFSDLQSSLGIARNILSRRLRGLEHHGLISRKLYCMNPPRHEYLLTDKGRDLVLPLIALFQLGDGAKANGVAPTAIPAAIPVVPVVELKMVFRHRLTNAALRATLIDTAGREVSPRDVVLVDDGRESLSAPRPLMAVSG